MEPHGSDGDRPRRAGDTGDGPDLLIGQTLGHYHIVDRLGGGGMGVVYRAEDTRLRRPVALKFISEGLSHDPEALARFSREAQAASALSHPNICTVYDLSEQAGRSFIVMEYLEGLTLKDLLAAGPISLPTLLDFGTQIADALDAAHAAGIIHRDIKPANIFIGFRDHVTVLDFGIAKMRAHPHADATTVAGTRHGVVVGTAAYMAPEQAGGEAVDHRADIWSFGLVLHEMATGKRPVPAVTLRIAGAPELERIIAKCLEPDRELRYQSAAEACADLKRLRRGLDVPGAPRQAIGHRGAMTLAAAAVVAVAAAGAGWTYRSRPAPLTDRDTIVLANFTNTTGDAVFDDALRQGLAVELQQSPFLSLISNDRVARTLALMGQRSDARLTPALAQDLCVRTASAVVVEGSIATLGSQYVVGLRARSCSTGDVLADEQAQAGRKEDVLAALSQIAVRFRTRIGESVATIERHSVPLQDATTPSLEALKAYSAGAGLVLTSSRSAAAFFERAVEIDPNFAMAHARLGLRYSSLGESNLSQQSILKAYKLRDRVSQAERFYIDMIYDRDVSGNLEREQRTLESWVQAYPRDPVPVSLQGGFVARSIGKYGQAVEQASKALAIDPELAPTMGSKAVAELHLNRLTEAETTVRLATERKLDADDLVLVPYFIAFLRGNAEALDRTATAARSRRPTEDMIAHLEALVLARSGQLREARRKASGAVEIARRAGQHERTALFEVATAVWESLHGNAAAARQQALQAMALARSRHIDYAAALAFALSGDMVRARQLTDDLERDFPEDTSVQSLYLPALRGLFAIDAGDPSAAIHALQSASRYDLGIGGLAFYVRVGALYPIYVRGLAHFAARRPAEAAAEFQRILDHRSIVLVDPVDAMARLQLARALTLLGDTAKARSTYNELFTLWENADPEIPVVKQARAEYARLR